MSNKRDAKRRARDASMGGRPKKRRQDPLQGLSGGGAGGGGSALAALAHDAGNEDTSAERRAWASINDDPATKALKLKARYEKKRIESKKKRREKVHGRGGNVNTRNARNARMGKY